MCRRAGFLDTLRRRFYHRDTRKIACKVFRMLTLEARIMLFTRTDFRRTIWGGILILALLVLPLARAEEQKILTSGAQPVQILEAFEAVVAEPEQFGMPKDNLDEWMLRWAALDPMKDVTAKLQQALGEGYLTRKSNPEFIKHEIERLSVNERARAG